MLNEDSIQELVGLGLNESEVRRFASNSVTSIRMPLLEGLCEKNLYGQGLQRAKAILGFKSSL